MSDLDGHVGGITIEAIETRFAQFEAEARRLAAENVQLSQRLIQVENELAHYKDTPSIEADQSAGSTHDQTVSRRGALLALGGAAAGGVGLVLGSTLISAEPAAAAGTVSLGVQNNETATTNFTNSTASSNALTGVATSNAAGVHGILGGASGIGVPAAGVLGDTSTGSPGVVGLSETGSGVYGVSQGASGLAITGAVVGDSHTSYGVVGVSQGTGVYGISNSPSGLSVTGAVVGDAQTNVGVVGLSQEEIGVYGVTGSASGHSAVGAVVGDSSASRGVVGLSLTSIGVYGTSGAIPSGIHVDGAVVGDSSFYIGVVGLSNESSGVYGVSLAQSGLTNFGGVVGDSSSGNGVVGMSNTGTGVYGESNTGAGISGTSSGGVGVLAHGHTYGLQVSGSKAQLYLVPLANAGAPTSGKHVLGELLLDKNGTLYVCVAKGTPGTWKAVQFV